MNSRPVIRIGARGSPLALVQAEMMRQRICQANAIDPTLVEIVTIRTSGDRTQGVLYDVGGKGLFVKELEIAMDEKYIDCAVHSMKDVPTFILERFTIAAYLPREDVREAFISPIADTLATLPFGASFGTSSPRRAAQIRRLRPDLAIIHLRGNVQTRLEKTQNRVVDATFLALAGLNRIGLAHYAKHILSPQEMLPALGQGAIGIECRRDNSRIYELLHAADTPQTRYCLQTERAFLEVLDGSCRSPIAGLAQWQEGRIHFTSEIIRPDGQETHKISCTSLPADGARMGAELGRKIKARAREGFFDWPKGY